MRAHCRTASIVALLALVVLLAPASAAADEPDAKAEAAESASGPPASVEAKRLSTSYKLFDMAHTTTGGALEIAQFRAQSVHNNDYLHGTEIAVGSSVTARHGIFYLNGLTQTNLRIVSDRGFAWSLPTYNFRAGLALGPLEVGSRIGLSFLTLDTIRSHFSFEFLSPRFGADVGLRFGGLRVEAGVYSEILWRWLDSTYRVQGFFFGASFEAKPTLPFERKGDPSPLPSTLPSLPGFGLP